MLFYYFFLQKIVFLTILLYNYVLLHLYICLMVNTLSQDNSPKFSIPAIYPINTAIEGLWKDSFNDEYRPNAVIDFVKIKNMLLDDPYNQLVPDYNYKIISPKDLCDILIKN